MVLLADLVSNIIWQRLESNTSQSSTNPVLINFFRLKLCQTVVFNQKEVLALDQSQFVSNCDRFF